MASIIALLIVIFVLAALLLGINKMRYDHEPRLHTTVTKVPTRIPATTSETGVNSLQYAHINIGQEIVDLDDIRHMAEIGEVEGRTVGLTRIPIDHGDEGITYVIPIRVHRNINLQGPAKWWVPEFNELSFEEAQYAFGRIVN